MKNELFIMSKTKYLRLFSEHEEIEKLAFMYEVKIYWQDGIRAILAGESFSCFFAGGLYRKLLLAVEGNLLFDSAVCSSPGVLKNKYFILEVFRKRSWTLGGDGIRYSLFKTHSELINKTGYLYNDEKGNVVFEIGEMFSWPNKEEFLEKELIDLEKKFLFFIDNYKPIVKEIIPLEVAKKWLDQAKNLNEIINNNEMKGFASQ